MMQRFDGKRVVVTDADEFMGPAVSKMLREEGAQVLADTRDLTQPDAAHALIEQAGRVDVLIANLAGNYTMAPAHEATESDLSYMLARFVFPLQRLFRAVLPQMIERRQGKIVVVGSALGLRGTVLRANYCAARAAQLGLVRAAGLEAIQHNVHINATAQAFVENPTYYPPEYKSTDDFVERMKMLPAGRLSTGADAASLVLYLASGQSDFFVGQVVPYSGGFVPT